MQKTEGLHTYFVSVYLSNPITVLPSTLETEFTVLNNVNISVPTIENHLASCSDSALMGNDFFPSSIARDCFSTSSSRY